MSEIKWIKLSVGLFDNKKIEVIETLPEADTLIVIWLKLLTMAGKSNAGGSIMLTDTIPYTEDQLISLMNRPITTVRAAFNLFKQYGMIEIWEDGRVYLSSWEKHQNVDGMERIRELDRNRKRKQREKQRALLLQENGNSHVTVTGQVAESSVTIRDSHATDIDIDIDKEKEIKHIVDSDECNNAFEQFWSLYPSKTGKKPALRKWVSLWKDKQIDMQTVIEGTKRYIEYVEHRRSTGFQLQYKNGSTFVSQECWNDEYQIPEVDHGTTGESAEGAYPGIDFGF